MKRQLLLFGILLLAAFHLEAQTLSAYKKAAEKSFAAKDYYSAMEYARLALEKSPKEVALQFQCAEAARKFQAYDYAKDWYIKVLEQEDAYPSARYYLALIRQGEGDYENALLDFTSFMESPGAEEELKIKAKREMANCKWALSELPLGLDLQVRPLKKSVNTPYSEFAPMMYGDTLYYSSFRYENKADKVSPKRKLSKVLYSVKASRGRPLPRKFNEVERHTAYTSISPKGDRIYYSICEYIPQSLDIRCELVFRKKDKRKRWGKFQKLSDEINLPGFTATHPQVTYDEHLKKEVLYFVSNRPGGKGGLDIWRIILKENGKAGELENLSELNTPEDEVSPFFYRPSQTLFFSSNGYPGFGNFDIYQSQNTTGEWTAAKNLAHPINSSYNDLFYSLNADSTIAHLSSNREGSLSLDRKLKSCCNDIFRIVFPKPVPVDTSDTEIPVVEIPEDSLWTSIPEPKPSPEPPFEPSRLEDFLPLKLYFDNDEPDRRTRRTTTRKTYGETFDRYYEQKNTYLREYTDGLEEEKRWDAEERMEGFFEQDVRRNATLLDRFAEILLKRLQGEESVEIFLKGFTSPRANSDYNLNLGQRRISSVRNHFYQYQDGIFLPFLNAGKLKITERSFGEISAKQGVSADLADRRNSIYSIDAAMERRVEIMEIKTSY